MYSLYKDVSFADGTSAEYKAEYHEVNGEWVSEPGFGYASEEYLAECGYMNDSSEKIFEICMVTDVARKYIFDDETGIGESSLSGGNSDTGSGESNINGAGGDDTGSEEVFEELYDRPIGYHGGNRYEYRSLVINSDESCTFTRSDHEPYAGDLEGETNYYYDKNTNKTVMYIIYKNGSDFAYCDRD